MAVEQTGWTLWVRLMGCRWRECGWGHTLEDVEKKALKIPSQDDAGYPVTKVILPVGDHPCLQRVK